jgi:cell wall-associated NlpC family hydrolase
MHLKRGYELFTPLLPASPREHSEPQNSGTFKREISKSKNDKGNSAKKELDFTVPKLRPGDIIFCSTKGYESVPGFYSHIGIYIGKR